MKTSNNSLGRTISLLYRYGHIYIGRQLEGYEISKGQYIILNALYKKDGISQEEISDYLKIDKGTTAKVIKQLEKGGYITRETSSTDKRLKRIYLTQKALEIKPIIQKTFIGWNKALWNGFTEEEKKLTIGMIERIAENAIKKIENSMEAECKKENGNECKKDRK
ncbi:MAG: MarR family winged helix-turn-helix transcriptional regulator [Caulobacteraceae bacterium]